MAEKGGLLERAGDWRQCTMHHMIWNPLWSVRVDLSPVIDTDLATLDIIKSNCILYSSIVTYRQKNIYEGAGPYSHAQLHGILHAGIIVGLYHQTLPQAVSPPCKSAKTK
jgi:hypothetical protein